MSKHPLEDGVVELRLPEETLNHLFGQLGVSAMETSNPKVSNSLFNLWNAFMNAMSVKPQDLNKIKSPDEGYLYTARVALSEIIRAGLRTESIPEEVRDIYANALGMVSSDEEE